MAYIEQRRLKDDSVTYRVGWRQDGKQQSETFGGEIPAERFKLDVEETGNRWPEGWIKGQGYVEQQTETPGQVGQRLHFTEAMDRYVGQLTDVQSDTRKRYRGQVKKLAAWECCRPDRPGTTYRPFDRPVGAISDEDVRHWAIKWDGSAKTKRNYLYALMAPGFKWMLRKKMITENPAEGIPLDERAIRPMIRHLTEDEWRLLHGLAPADIKDMLEVTVGTGLRFGEVTALMPRAVNLKRRLLTVEVAWKRKGEDGEWELDPTYRALLKEGRIGAKHQMLRGHYLGAPKTKASLRTIPISRSVATVLARVMEGKDDDDFLFTSPTGLPVHSTEFYEDRWKPLLRRARRAGLKQKPRFHDLRHTYAVWLLSMPGVTAKVVQFRLGHDSLQTTTDTYGGFLNQVSDAADEAIDQVLGGGYIRLVPDLDARSNDRNPTLIEPVGPDEDDDGLLVAVG